MSLFNKHIGLNGFSKSLLKLFKPSAENTTESKEDHYVPKTYGEEEDNFTLNMNPSAEDLKRYGTSETLIDVADDRLLKGRQQAEIDIRNKIFQAPQKPSHKRFTTTYEEDLKRFGTPETLIDVSNDGSTKKQKIARQKQFDCKGLTVSKVLHKDILSQGKQRVPGKHSQNPFADAYQEFPRMQVTITNTGNEDRNVVLWGAARYGTAGNFSVSSGPPLPEIVSLISHLQAVYPQPVIYNPANQLIYVANQISGTVSVINTDNEIVTIVQLNPTYVGTSSAIALAVNTSPFSTHYGAVYVAGSVSNTVSVITSSFTIEAEINVGVRPVSLAFNSVNNMVYVANFNSNTLSVINTENNSVSDTINVGANPVGLGVNPMSGDIYVSNATNNTITVIGSDNAVVNTVTYGGQYPTSIIYHPINDCMYAIARDSNQVHQINAATYQLITTLNVGPSPYNCFFNPADGMFYVQSSTTGDILLIDQNNAITSTLQTGIQSIGAAINPQNNLLYISNPLAGNIQVWNNYSPTQLSAGNTLTVDPDYSLSNADFQFSPAIIKHVRFIMNGPERVSAFKLEHFTPTGRLRSKPISFENFVSPQVRLNVAEAVSLAGTVIDGQTAWRFKLPAHQSLSILIWYVQIRVSKLFTNPQNLCT